MVKIIDPWGSELVKDYDKLIKDFGLEPFNPKLFPNPNKLMRRGVVFAGQGLKQIARAVRKKEDFYVLTGIMPSAEKVHFGTKMVVENVKYFQEQGAETYLLVADLEAAATRGIGLKEAKRRALNFHIPAYIALGLDPKKTTFYLQSENDAVKNLAYVFSKKVTLNELKAIYGSVDPGRIMSALTQAGDILFPQLKKRMPGVVPVGVDNSPHLRLCRDLARRTKSTYNFILPAGMYHKFTPSLDGSIKMSKTKPAYCISLPENPRFAAKKIKNALTGGRESVKIQRELGGQPEKCMIFEMYKQHLIEDDKELQRIYDECKAGKLLCGEDKERAAKLMEEFMKDFTKKLKGARKQIKKLKFIRIK